MPCKSNHFLIWKFLYLYLKRQKKNSMYARGYSSVALSYAALVQFNSHKAFENRRTCRKLFALFKHVTYCFVSVLYKAVDLEVAVPYVVRGFFCGDQRLSYPYTESTVPNSLIYGTGTFPLIFVIVTAYNVIPLKKLYRIWVSYAFGISSIYFFMNVVKLFYGELRPNFFEACKPVWPNMNCSGYVTEFNCSGTNRKAAIESMRSFPSSHAGITIFGMLYLIIFTQEVFMNRRKQYHLGWAIFQWAGFLWAVYAGMSRITDNKHHIQDVIGGYVIGGVTSYWVAYYWSGLGEIGNNRTEKDGKAQNHLITYCSCQNGITVGKPKES